MVSWLAARQAGVTAARAAFCRAVLQAAGRALDCADGVAVHAAAGVEVLHGSEVNLVRTSMATGLPNNILRVVPRVPLDVVSYSSYDTMALGAEFGAALDFIAAHHNRTAASPPAPAVFVAEYGVPQMLQPDPADLVAVYANVHAYVLSPSPLGGSAGTRRAMHAFAWELFDNEVRDGVPGFPGQRCDAGTGQQTDPAKLNGFWLLRPDGSASPAFAYLAGLINGSVPLPTPTPRPAGPCTATPDTDMQGGAGGTVVHGVDATGCCRACEDDVQCTAAVLGGTDCYLKYGGAPVPKTGVTLLTPSAAGNPRLPAAPPMRPAWVPAGAARRDRR